LRTYTGIREKGRTQVSVDGQPLEPRLDLRNHSPTGFDWGYAGSGPAQLALAIVSDHLANDGLAEERYQAFKWAVVVNLPRDRWTLTGDEIARVLARLDP